MSDKSVFPGFNPKVTLSGLSKQEAAILNCLRPEFYISVSPRRIRVGQSEYHYFFVKFPSDKAAAFGTREEVIVILSSYGRFEPRMLEAVEAVQKENSASRLDKILAIVISNDVEFVDKFSRSIRTEKEYRLIIPFTYKELQTSQSEAFFRARIKQFSFERNLFDFADPLTKESYFFARDELCQQLIDRHNTNQNSGLFGLRRSGKTSVLLSTARRLRNMGGNATILNGQLLYLVPWYRALFLIAQQANKDLHTKIVVDESKYTPASAGDAFSIDVERIKNKARGKFLIAIDEVEHLSFDTSFSEGWREGDDYPAFWHVIRGNFQKEDNSYTLLLAGTNPHCLEMPRLKKGDNPLYEQITSFYLNGFSLKETEQMISTLSGYMGIRVDSDIYTYLMREYGGIHF